MSVIGNNEQCSDNSIVKEIETVGECTGSGVGFSCTCKDGVHQSFMVQDLGQNYWASVPKACMAKLNIENIDKKCKDLKLYMQQQVQHTGFIPLSPLQFCHIRSCSTCQVDKKWLQQPVKLYEYVKSFNCPNFLGARVQVNFCMNLDLIDRLAASYWDWQLPLFLRFGFPMDFRGNYWDLRNDGSCHASARDHPDHVTVYLEDEIHHGAIFGPFHQKPFGKITHISPFITRPKPDSDKRRVIVDLSWPDKGSVNHFTRSNEYLGTAFKLTYPSVDTFVERLRSLGKGCQMFKIDLSRAFRQLKVDPGDYPLLRLEWQDSFYLDTCFAFGHRSGSMGCSRLSDFLRYLHSKSGFYLLSYIDDLLGAEIPSRAQSSYDTLFNLLQELRIPVSKAKLCSPSTKIVCLGIQIDSEKATMSIPDQKLQDILKNCRDFIKLKRFTKRQLQSLIGSLMFVHKVVKPARYFVNRLLETLRGMSQVSSMTVEIRRDVNWFLSFMEHFNGTCSYLYTPVQCNYLIELDACLTGLGARFNNQVYQYQFKDKEVPCSFSIVHLEMWNVLIALRVWANEWNNCSLVIKCDNEAVVSVVNLGVTRDSALVAMARNIWLITASHNIKVRLVHIPGVNNECADLLSRWGITKRNFEKLSKYVINPVWVQVKNCHMEIDVNI